MSSRYRKAAFAAVICALGLVYRASAGIVAYWDFSSDSNGVTDVSGNYNTLVNSGVVISNGTAVFNGNHSAFSTARTLNLSSYSALTIEFFMRTTETANLHMLLEQSAETATHPGAFYFDLNEIAPGGIFTVFRTYDGHDADKTTSHVAANGQWHHVAWVYTKGSSTIDTTLYLDGVQQEQDPVTFSTTMTALRNDTLFIGSRANREYRYVGEMDDIRISDTALVPGQFLTARTEGTPPVIAYWRFNEGEGLTDSSGQGNTLTGSAVFTNGVARFNGTDSTLSTISSLNLSGCTNLTIEFFLRTTVSAQLMMLLEQSVETAPRPGAFYFDLNENNARGLIYSVFRTTDSHHVDQTATDAAADGQWHHVAWVYDVAQAGDSRARLYLDGVEQAQGLYANSTTTPTLLNDILYIGSRANSAYLYAGEMDDIKITGKALYPGQFQRTPSTPLPTVIAYWPFLRHQPLADMSGNGHTLNNAGVSFGNEAAVFNGSQTAFDTKPWTLNLRPYSALTIEYFIRTTSATLQLVVEHSENINYHSGAFASSICDVTSGELYGSFSLPGGNLHADGTPPNKVSDGRWHHVALVYDPNQSGENRVRLYFDGVQQSEKPYGGFSSDADNVFLNDILFIGSRANSEYQFAGELDDVKITGAVLTPFEFMKRRTNFAGTLISVQ